MLNRRHDRPQSPHAWFGKQKNLVILLGFKPLGIQPVALSLYQLHNLGSPSQYRDWISSTDMGLRSWRRLKFSFTPIPRTALEHMDSNTSGQRLSSVTKQANFGDGNSLQPNEQVQQSIITNSAIRISCHTSLYGSMIVKIRSKICARMQSCPNLRYQPSICLEGLGTTV